MNKQNLKKVTADELTWEVLGEIPSAKNELRFSSSGRPYHKDNAVREYKQSFAMQTPAKYKLNIACPVMVFTTIFQKDRRRDAHNATAVIYDALETAGVIYNDRLIVKWGGTAKIDKKNPRVLISLLKVMGEEKRNY